ncbi:MAG: NUDIX domain-containing protein [Bacilli bacterium]|jgi:8-oxo-dGTP diphosphatase|nr:NUDIX domain-containing protein [Bacilli bacterium]
MEKERYKLRCGVFLIISKIENNKEYVLLQKRQNTRFLDNLYDLACSGHLEENESAKNAIIREAKEEIGIDIEEQDLQFISTMHTKIKNKNLEYIFIIFKSINYNGIPTIKEPDKCSNLTWFDIENLPVDIIESRKIMLNNYLNKIPYYEYGFNKEEY